MLLLVEGYVEDFIIEIKVVLDFLCEKLKMVWFYLGGGILMFLSFVFMDCLFDVVFGVFDFVEGFEFLVEIDLIEVVFELLVFLVKWGMWCVSIGV